MLTDLTVKAALSQKILSLSLNHSVVKLNWGIKLQERHGDVLLKKIYI